ncbi:hypothetical protein ACFQ14_16750 [Pseudahrensia aquimaris]|uniref:HAD family hydrolase n=1 Tax=Pseudahrensia aquimaris TaxID=744461 RepID=A0ABW3FHW5_9HYPH
MTEPKKNRTMSAETTQQLESLGFHESADHGTRPLLICDVDEVVLHLVDPFEQVLNEQGFYLKSHSFQLTGNVFCSETHREATQEEVWNGLDVLFQQQASRQGIVDGVIDGLNTLAEEIDIVFLTNLPHAYREIRIDYLAEHGLNHPLVTNSGSKVPAMDRLMKTRQAQVGFIDDTPTNLIQARESLPDLHLFHFMANDRFRAMAQGIEGAHFSTGHWGEAVSGIRSVLMAET